MKTFRIEIEASTFPDAMLVLREVVNLISMDSRAAGGGIGDARFSFNSFGQYEQESENC